MQELSENQNSIQQSTQQDNILKAKVSMQLARISALKCISLQQEHILIWNEQIKNDIETGDIIDIKTGFKKLLSEKAYGGLDYEIFLEGAKKDLSKEASEQLVLCLTNKSKVNERTKSILKEFGGFRYLSEMSNAEVPLFRKEFLKAYVRSNL